VGSKINAQTITGQYTTQQWDRESDRIKSNNYEEEGMHNKWAGLWESGTINMGGHGHWMQGQKSFGVCPEKA